MYWDDNRDVVDWSEATEQLALSDGYQQRSNPPLPPQDPDTDFLDGGEREQTAFADGYQQVDYIPPTIIPPPDDIPFDWSDPGTPDFIASWYGNTNPTQPPEEDWRDEEIEEDLTWQWIDDNGYATALIAAPRQDGDDEIMCWFTDWTDTSADDDSGLDVIRGDENPVVPNVIPPTTVLMPNILGLPFEEGFTICFSVGLNLQSPPQQENVYYPFAIVPAGIIVQQFPLPLTPTPIGATVYAIVSSGLIVYPQGATVNNGNEPVVVIGDDTPV
jgi:hypothetical protein